MFLKHPHIPRTQPSTPDQDPPSNLQRTIHSFHLCRSLGSAGREPVHTIHQHGDGKGFGRHVVKDVGKFVCVDAQVVEGTCLGEAEVGFGG